MSKLKVALDLVPEKVEGLIRDHADDIEKAWLKREENENLTVSFGAKFYMEQGQNCCDVSIAFTPEKIKDHTRFTFDERQGKLFPDKKKEPPKEHVWEKQNLVTIAAAKGVPMHDVYKCKTCGATSKRFGIGGAFKLDKKFAKLEGCCPGEKK